MNKKAKSIISVLLAIVLCFSSSTVAFASVDDGGSVTFELSSDKKDYARDETITITTNIKNSTQENQNVSISYLSTGFIQLEQSNSTASVSIGAEKDIQQKAKAWRLITPKAKHQDLVDGLMGHLWSFLYEILAMLSNNYKMLQVTVDDCPAVVLAKISGTSVDKPSDPTEPEVPVIPENPTQQYTVSFDLNYEGANNRVTEFTVIKGKQVDKPENPTRENYIFDGWYTEAEGGNLFNFESTVNNDITLYAHWIENSSPESVYNVTFLLNDGSDGVYVMQSVFANHYAVEPKIPEKEQFAFTGWYTEPQCINKFDFSQKIKANLSIYAGWKMNDSDAPISGGGSGGGTIYSITDFKIEDGDAKVTINVNDYSVLAIYFLNEDTEEEIGRIASLTPRYCELEEVSIPITVNLPEHFVAKIQLLDEDGNLRCNEFRSIKYTYKQEQFDNLTINDFDQDRVINFDNNNSNNFAVLAEGVIKIDQSAGKNEVVRSYSKSDSAVSGFVMNYTFTNVDSTVSGLSSDDVIYAVDTDGMPVLFKVGEVKNEGASYTFTESTDSELLDFYEVLKVDDSQWISSPQRNRSLAKASRGIELINAKGTMQEKEYSIPINYKVSDNVTISGELTGKIGGEVNFQYDVHLFGENYVKSDISTKINAKIEIKAEYKNEFREKEFSLGDLDVPIPTPIPGLNVLAEFKFGCSVTGKASVSASAEITKTTGFKYDTINGNQEIDKKTYNAEILDAEGSLEMKIGPEVRVGLGLFGDVISATIGIEAGAQVTFTAETRSVEITDEDDVHACGLCIKGDVKIYLDGNAKLSYEISKKWSGDIFTWTFLKLELNVPFIGGYTTFYFSVIHSADSCFGTILPQSGFGECPNKKYKTKIILKDSSNNIIDGTNIVIKNQNGEESAKGKSTLTKYLYNGKYTLNTEVEGQNISKTFVVSSASQEIVINKDSSDSTIKGTVVDIADNRALKDVNVKITKNNYCIDNLKTDDNGNFSINVPDGIYLVEITKDEYMTFSQYIKINNSGVKQLPTILMEKTGKYKHGGLCGTIEDATNNSPIKDATIYLLKGWDNYGYDLGIKTTTTNNNGEYKWNLKKFLGIPIGSIEAGNYTLKIVKAGYVTGYCNVTVKANNENGNQNAVISPVSIGNYRIVLTWGAYPSDLDSHMTGNMVSGAYDHIYYNRKTGYAGNLDVDDTSSYGPETITITDFDKFQNGFTYSVHDYSNKSSNSSSAMSNSNATVVLYKGDTILETYYIPTNTVGTVWRVFSIDADGNIQNLNEFYNQSDSSLVN